MFLSRICRLLAWLFAVAAILLPAVAVLILLAFLQVADYREKVETLAGQALGRPVELAGIDARLGPLGPEITVSGARILSGDRQRAQVSAESGSIRFDVLSLLRGQARIARIDLADVTIRVGTRWSPHWQAPEIGASVHPASRVTAAVLDLSALEVGLRNLQVEFEGALDGRSRGRVTVDAVDLSIQAVMSLVEPSGVAGIIARGWLIDWPEAFPEPLRGTETSAVVALRRTPEAFQWELREVAVEGDGLSATGAGTLELPTGNGPPSLAFEVAAGPAEIAALLRHVPMGVLPAPVASWLQSAFRAGRSDAIRAEFRGPVPAFPFRDGEGLFRVDLDLTGAELRFAPGWPNATALDAAVRLENDALTATIERASVQGVDVGPVAVTVPNLAEGELNVSGSARGTLAAVHELVLRSEFLAERLGPDVTPAEVTAGQTTAQMNLMLPLANARDYRIELDVEVSQGTVFYGFLGAPLTGLDAGISITEAGIRGGEMSAALAGDPLSARASTDPDGTIHVDARGRLSAEGLSGAFGVPVEGIASGSSDWTGTLRFPPHGKGIVAEAALDSPLDGVALALPGPFGKPGAASRELSARAVFREDGVVDATVEWGPALTISAHRDGFWEIDLAGERVAGRIGIPSATQAGEPVKVNLDHLWLQRDSASDPEAPKAVPGGERSAGGPLPPSPDPASVPSIEIAVQDLRYEGIRLGSVSAELRGQPEGIVLDRLRGQGEGFSYRAEGRWQRPDAQEDSRIAVLIEAEDVGQALDLLGFGHAITAQDGHFEAQVNWPGGTHGEWLAMVEGHASVALGKGSLGGIERRAGRALGLLSIDALPRRLALDFKDVFSKGLAFDSVSGDFQLAAGNGYTENFMLQGPSVEVGVVGRIGLATRDYDQTVLIGADLGGALPLVTAAAAGPAAGAAVYLLSQRLKRRHPAQLTYHISGSWDDPVVERVALRDRTRESTEPAE
jgi:uncharacterized protein YhdP